MVKDTVRSLLTVCFPISGMMSKVLRPETIYGYWFKESAIFNGMISTSVCSWVDAAWLNSSCLLGLGGGVHPTVNHCSLNKFDLKPGNCCRWSPCICTRVLVDIACRANTREEMQNSETLSADCVTCLSGLMTDRSSLPDMDVFGTSHSITEFQEVLS